MVISLPPLFAGFQILHLYPLLLRIDFKYLMPNPRVNVLFFMKFPGGPRNQIIDIVDNTWMYTTDTLRDTLIDENIDIYPEYTGNG